MSKQTVSTTIAPRLVNSELKARGYPNADDVAKPRNLLNLEARNAVGPWPRNARGWRELTVPDHIDELVEYFIAYFRVHGVFPVDNAVTTDPEDTAGRETP